MRRRAYEPAGEVITAVVVALGVAAVDDFEVTLIAALRFAYAVRTFRTYSWVSVNGGTRPYCFTRNGPAL